MVKKGVKVAPNAQRSRMAGRQAANCRGSENVTGNVRLMSPSRENWISSKEA